MHILLPIVENGSTHTTASTIPQMGMRINTSRGHLPLHHHHWQFRVFEVRNSAMKRQSKRLFTKCSDSRSSHPIPALLKRYSLTWHGVDIYCYDVVRNSSKEHHYVRLRKSGVKLQKILNIKNKMQKKNTKRGEICCVFSNFMLRSSKIERVEYFFSSQNQVS